LAAVSPSSSLLHKTGAAAVDVDVIEWLVFFVSSGRLLGTIGKGEDRPCRWLPLIGILRWFLWGLGILVVNFKLLKDNRDKTLGQRN